MPDPVTTGAAAAQSSFDENLNQSVQGLRGALTELLVGGDEPLRGGQELSRRYGLNRNVAWKLTRIANSTDAIRACQHLPGSGGMRIVLDSLQREGAPAPTVERLRAAWEQLDRTIELHAGDRSTFELMLRSMSADDDSGSMEASRRAAFEGNSAVWGVQARTLFSTHLLAPRREEPDMIDNGLVGGLVDFKRLRPTADWVLGRKVIQSHLPEGEESWEESMAGDGNGGLALLEDFSSKPLPEVRVVPEQNAARYVLPAGEVGVPGAITCAFGWIQRRAQSLQAKDNGGYDEHFLRISTPARWAQLDLLVHEALAPKAAPDLFLFDLVHGLLEFPLTLRTDFHLPIDVRIDDLGQGPPVMASRHVPRYEALVRLAVERMGWPLSSFRAFRVTMAYPPLPAALVLSFPNSSLK